MGRCWTVGASRLVLSQKAHRRSAEGTGLKNDAADEAPAPTDLAGAGTTRRGCRRGWGWRGDRP